jgi:KUP system potassium uptake protein
VPGGAVFLAPSVEHVPPVLVHHVELTRALQETVVLLTVIDMPVPEVKDDERSKVEPLTDGFWRITVRFGYMEQPLLIPLLRRLAAEHRIPFDVDTATFFIGHSTIIANEGGRLSHIPEVIFAYLKRNAVQEERRYQVPADRVMEIGEQISL